MTGFVFDTMAFTVGGAVVGAAIGATVAAVKRVTT